MRDPDPTAPVAGWISTPAARPFKRPCRSLIGAVWVTLAASIRDTALPISRCAVAPAVPVTTTCSSSRAFGSRAIRSFVSPTFTVSVRARNPIIRIWSTVVAPETSFNANRPLASVNARSAVPATLTCAAATGPPVARLTTTPATDPACAGNEPDATMPSVRARLHRTEEHRMPRPQERRGCLYYRHAEVPQGRGPRVGHQCAARWRAVGWHDMFSNSISVGARMPVRFLALALLLSPVALAGQRTQKPALHGRHWVAITGKPLAATAGAMIFQKGGNPVDAACAMLAAVTTMWDVLSWGGETQALIYNPQTKKVIAINALGVAPTGATPAFYRSKGMHFPPEYGPLAAITPGTPGGLMTMLAEYGKLSLRDVLEPAIRMADGYAIEEETANSIERNKGWLKQWRYSRAVMLPHAGEAREAPEAGEIFRQADLAATLRKLVDAEQQALRQGKSRRDAIMAAYARFYTGDIAQEFVRGLREEGGLITLQDLASWKVKIEEPVMTTYRGIDVYKLQPWSQGPAMLEALNILENFDLKAMGYNSARYIHTVYQAMSLAFADRDFYYGDPAFPPEEPIRGLLSKDYARKRAQLIHPDRNDPGIKPGDPYPFQGGTNPYWDLLRGWPPPPPPPARTPATSGGASQTEQQLEGAALAAFDEAFTRGTTSIEAADTSGWVVSITPSGGWIPAVIAGRTGIGASQRAQQFVVDSLDNPFNVIAPGKRPRVTLTPGLALKDGKPFLASAVQGGDTQDQNLLQCFLDMVEFGMTVQEAVEAANITSYQMRNSFGDHESQPGRLTLRSDTPPWVRRDLYGMGYRLDFQDRTSGPINAIFFDWKHGSFWGGSSNHGEDYGIAW